mmetsp:Transcript_20502/g.36985  ORF Transcript_20502/g.36985 Transcript_20502/m.36985 type:complete len:279 (+) Transcript_20502:598-1434(+)
MGNDRDGICLATFAESDPDNNFALTGSNHPSGESTRLDRHGRVSLLRHRHRVVFYRQHRHHDVYTCHGWMHTRHRRVVHNHSKTTSGRHRIGLMHHTLSETDCVGYSPLHNLLCNTCCRNSICSHRHIAHCSLPDTCNNLIRDNRFGNDVVGYYHRRDLGRSAHRSCAHQHGICHGPFVCSCDHRGPSGFQFHCGGSLHHCWGNGLVHDCDVMFYSLMVENRLHPLIDPSDRRDLLCSRNPVVSSDERGRILGCSQGRLSSNLQNLHSLCLEWNAFLD